MSLSPSNGVRLYILDDQGILFSEPAQELYSLNTTATFIWCQLEEGCDEPGIVQKLNDNFNLVAGEAEQYLSAALESWKTLGLIAGYGQPDVAQEKDDEGNEPKSDDFAPYRPRPFESERWYRILDSFILMRFSSLAQLEIVHPVLAHLETDNRNKHFVSIDILNIDDTIVIYRDRVPQLACDHLSQLAPLAKSLVWDVALTGHDFFLDIHAGVIGDGENCYLLPAPSGSGKSTLTAGLVNAGFDFFSDEIALLEEGSFKVRPVPLAICIKSTGIKALSRYYPALETLSGHDRSDGKLVHYMPPPEGSIPRSNKSLPVGAIIFPEYRPGVTTQVQRLSNVEALQRLMDQCLIVSSRLDRHKVLALIDWIQSIPCHHLLHSSVDEAVHRVRQITNEAQTRP